MTTSEPGTDGGPTSATQPPSNMQTLGKDFGRLQNDLARMTEDARQVADSGAAVAGEAGRITARTVKTKGSLATTAFRNRVVSHPLMALGIAVGAGVLIGLVAPTILTRKSKPTWATRPLSSRP